MHSDYESHIHNGGTALDAFSALNISRMCCRRMFLGYVNITSDLINHPSVDQLLDDGGTVMLRKVKIIRTSTCV